MRLLLTVSIVFTLSIGAWSAHRLYNSTRVIESLSETPVSTQTQVPDSTVVPVTTVGSYSNMDISETSSGDNLINDIEENIFESIEENTFESAQEACCPEDADDRDTNRDTNAETNALVTPPTLEELREIWTQKHGDIPEIDTYITLHKKMRRGEQMTMEEDLAFLRSLAFLHPLEQNIKAYETLKELTSRPGPDGAYKSTHGLRE